VDEGSRAAAPGGGLLDSRREVPAVPDNIVLIMRFHPVGGEDVTVVSEDFGGEHEALEAIAQALDGLPTEARYLTWMPSPGGMAEGRRAELVADTTALSDEQR
jgi:hypothetical protein